MVMMTCEQAKAESPSEGRQEPSFGKMPTADNTALVEGLSSPGGQEMRSKCMEESRLEKQDVCTESTDTRTSSNTSPSIHAKLPPEILYHIYRHIHPTSVSDIRLTHVCRIWRNMIQQTPEFWVDMLDIMDMAHTHLDDDELLTFIERTSSRLFSLRLGMRAAFLKSIPSHLVRLSSLSILLAQRFTNVLSDILLLDMPSLEDLSVRHLIPVRHYDDVRLFEARQYAPSTSSFPRLRRIHCDASLLVPALGFPSLREISILGSILALDTFLDTLWRCPDLEVLELSESIGAWFSANRQLLPRALSLPKLRGLIMSAKYGSAEAILEYIAFPATTHLEISCGMAEFCNIFPRSLYPVIGLVDSLSVSFVGKGHPGHWMFTLKGMVEGVECVSVTIHRAQWGARNRTQGSSEILCDVTTLFAPSQMVTSMELHLGKGVCMPKDDWSRFLNAFVFLETLIVRIDSCRNLIYALRVLPPPCFAMKHLSIACENGTGRHESVVRALEMRASMGMRLTKLEYHGREGTRMSGGLVERLKATVPSVVIE